MFAKYAQYYIDMGLSVFPVMSNKHPAIPAVIPFRTNFPTPEQIAEWSRGRMGGMNIGVICGKLSNLLVIDADTPAAVAKIESLLPEQYKVPSATTPKGGRHFYFRHAPGFENWVRCRAGIDIRTENSYVLLPPSQTKATPDGKCIDGEYKQHKGEDIKARGPLPEEVAAYLREGKVASGKTQDAETPPLSDGRRHNDMFKAACGLIDQNLPQDLVNRVIVNVAKECNPPLPEKEALLQTEGAWKHCRKNPDGDGDTLAERDASTVRIRPIPWIWSGVIPTHMAAAITGDAGQGKSLVAVDIAARISRGRPFPIYDKAGHPVCGSVIYMTSEGVLEMILVPRLMAAGADLSKIKIIEGIYLKNGDFSIFDLTQHLPMLIQRARKIPDLVDLIVDPIVSFIPDKINTNQQNQVRQMMDRISDFAYKLGIAATPVMHFAKAPGGKAIHKTAGSGQFEAAVKMSWSVIHRPDDPRNVRLLVPQKSNINAAYQSLSFTIHPVDLPDPNDPKIIIETAKIEYGNLVDEDPEILISPPMQTDNHVTEAVKFLTRKLREGTILHAVPLIDEAKRAGVPKWALYKAKDRLGVDHDKERCFQGKTFWFLPKDKTP